MAFRTAELLEFLLLHWVVREVSQKFKAGLSWDSGKIESVAKKLP